MIVPGSANALLLASAAPTGYNVERSLRFNSSDSAYLSRTPASAGNRKQFTISFWVKRSTLGTTQMLFHAGNASSNPVTDNFRFRYASDVFEIILGGGVSSVAARFANVVYRDCSAWQHIVLAIDTDQAAIGNAFKLYANGIQTVTATSFGSVAYSSGINTAVNAIVSHNIGRDTIPSSYFDGYLADVHLVDGQALDPTNFGELDANGTWQPIAYTGTYGTNGFHLPFSDNSTAAALGTDTSGNGNDWTVNNISNVSGGPTSVAAASGALPVYNTTDTYGTTKGTGTRTDSNNSSIVLAIPMDGANNGTTFTDVSNVIRGSGSAKTISRFGDTKTSTAQSKYYGSSGYFDGTGDYLQVPSSADFQPGSGDFTFEAWVYRTGGDSVAPIFNKRFAASPSGYLFSAGQFSAYINGSWRQSVITATVPTNRWLHVALVRSGNVFTLYHDGTSVGSYTQSGTMSDDAVDVTIGIAGGTTEALLQGYLQDLRVYKGVAKYTSNFNPPSATQNTTIAAGNDSLVDTPTSYGTDTGTGGEVRGNYCTLNPLDKTPSYGTLSNGNLDWVYSGQVVYAGARSTIGVFTGKWYFECTANGTPSAGFTYIGVATKGFNFDDSTNILITGNETRYYRSDGNKSTSNGSQTTASYGASYTTGDVIGIALDLDAGTITFYKNGTTQGQAYSGLSGTYFACGSSINNSGGLIWNFGQRPFAYTAPSGFKALCTTNLPAPVVAQPSTVMDVKLYTGNGSTQNITGLGFNPDLVWLKIRNTAGSHGLWDAIRGTGSRLDSGSTGDEDATVGVTAFNSDGFTVGGPYNSLSNTWVAWTWDAGTTTASNTQGSITSQVRANASAGFSIVTYTGNGTGGATVGHGLGVTCQFIVVKRLDSSASWLVLHTSVGLTGDTTFGLTEYYMLLLNTTSARVNYSQDLIFPGNSATFALGSGGSGYSNANGGDYVAYCFAPVDGYSSFGSYTGNGSADGPFVYTGFRPRWVMIKVFSGDTGAWRVYDSSRNTYNVVDLELNPNLSGAEYTASNTVDFTSNGFKIRTSSINVNLNTAGFIYAAFAENPFQYARAR